MGDVRLDALAQAVREAQYRHSIASLRLSEAEHVASEAQSESLSAYQAVQEAERVLSLYLSADVPYAFDPQTSKMVYRPEKVIA